MNTALAQDLFALTASAEAFERARKVLPAGLVSLIRRRDNQVVFTRAAGAHLWDVDGNRYIDCVMAHGPILLGHAHPAVNKAAIESLSNGVQFGGSYHREAVLAEEALKQLPFADKVTFMSTGTEAVQLAVRVARTTTGRNLVVKFEGHYHGWIDPLYVNIPGYDPQPPVSGLDGRSTLESPVKPAIEGAAVPDGVVVTRWNDLESFTQLMERIGDQVACVIMEPLLTGFGTFMPAEGYLQGLKDVCRRHGALVIFDEIVSGFRVSPSGASGLLGVSPDLGTYAKAMANGFPISMVAGTREAMSSIEDGRVPAAGTYSGTPSSLEASIASLQIINREGSAFYEYLDNLGAQLKAGLELQGRIHSAPIVVNQIGSLVQIFCGEDLDTQSVDGVYTSNRGLVTQVCEAMILRGVYMTRKGLIFLSRSHTSDDVDQIIEVFGRALADVLAKYGDVTK